MTATLHIDDLEAKGRNSSTRRQQVLDAAAATFSRLGYHGASTRAIADVLGIKVASLYFHIASKEEALEEICTLGVLRSISYLDRAMSEAEDLGNRIRRFFDHERDDLAAHADYVRVSIFEGRYLGREPLQRVEAHSARLRAKVDGMFAAALERGELYPGVSPREARFVLIGALRSISGLHVGSDIRQFDQIRATWVEAVIRGLVAGPAPS